MASILLPISVWTTFTIRKRSNTQKVGVAERFSATSLIHPYQYTKMNRHRIALIFLILISLISCNKDDVIEENVAQAPVITLDSESGIYTVKVGHELTITPTVEHAENAIITWTVDGKIVSRDITYTAVWNEIGEFYPVLTVQTEAGKAKEELKIEVVELTPPVISIVIPSQGLKVVAGTDYILTPTIQHDDMENFQMEWVRGGKVVSTEKSYTFHEAELGSYPITIQASNIDGKTSREITVEVVETMPYEVAFDTPSYFQTSNDRYTFINRPIHLMPQLAYFDHPVFSWVVDGEPVTCTDRTFVFTPAKSGKYQVTVTVTEGKSAPQTVSRNITRAATSITGKVTVHCVSNTESELYRPGSAASSKYQNKVYEWTPAPGQFIGETSVIGGMTGNETTLESANAWAAKRLSNKQFVSLGGFGGSIIIGFDHSIAKTSNDYDFAVHGNAFKSSNEPGIVWVMQDINRNGLPDDEWYELKGSETGKKETIQNYAVTYYKPAAPKMNVEWTDSENKTGFIEYLEQYHRQDYYYPTWIPVNAYTLRGTCLPSKNHIDPVTGYWSNAAYDWGYVDNVGSDNLKGGSSQDGSGQRNGFKIGNAIYPDGKPVDLKYIDFIKVQVGVNGKSGWLGEISTEVFSFEDLSIQ